MIAMIIGIFLTGLAIFATFNSLGWIVGLFNRSLNFNQRTRIGFYITLFFTCSIILKCCEWDNGLEKLEEKRAAAWKRNIPPGYYDINSPNLGNDGGIENNSEVNAVKSEVDAYDDKMAGILLFWILGYVLLVIIGFIGNIVYPLDND